MSSTRCTVASHRYGERHKRHGVRGTALAVRRLATATTYDAG
jgi:hypothetical protein